MRFLDFFRKTKKKQETGKPQESFSHILDRLDEKDIIPSLSHPSQDEEKVLWKKLVHICKRKNILALVVDELSEDSVRKICLGAVDYREPDRPSITYGLFVYLRTYGVITQRIFISRKSKSKLATFLHEFIHWVDMQVTGLSYRIKSSDKEKEIVAHCSTFLVSYHLLGFHWNEVELKEFIHTYHPTKEEVLALKDRICEVTEGTLELLRRVDVTS